MQDFETTGFSHDHPGSELSFGTTRSHVQIVSPRLEKQGESGTLFEYEEKSGLQTGLHPEANCTCSVCGKRYYLARIRNDRAKRRCCSPACSSAIGKLTPQHRHTPESTKAERVRANGLINKRIKLGHIKRPNACQKCGKKGRTDAHHPDYQQQDLVAFLCRSCHMIAHRDAEFEKEVARIARRTTLCGIAPSLPTPATRRTP